MERFTVPGKIRLALHIYISDQPLDVHNIRNVRVVELKKVERAVHRGMRSRIIWHHPDRHIRQRSALADLLSLRAHDGGAAHPPAQHCLVYEGVEARRLSRGETLLPVEPRFDALAEGIVINAWEHAPDERPGIVFCLEQRGHRTWVVYGD